MENEFHPMWKKPKVSNDDSRFSKIVLVYELDFDTKKMINSDLGYFDFEEETWSKFGEDSMMLYCWKEIPDPSEFMKDKDWVIALHTGYNP